MRVGKILYLLALAALALLSQWFLFSLESSLRDNGATDTEAPLIYMDDLVATRMNHQGIRDYTLTAPHLVQLPAQKGTRIETPLLEVFQDGQIHEWLIRSDSGWISPDHDVIHLEDAVSMTRPVSSGKPPLVVTTRDLVIYPQADYAETEAMVRAETPGGVVTGLGLKAHLHEKTLELLAAVRGHYAPVAR